MGTPYACGTKRDVACLVQELYLVNGWLFVEDVESRSGTVYFPTGEPTLSIAANFGMAGDSFASKREALEYFLHTPVA